LAIRKSVIAALALSGAMAAWAYAAAADERIVFVRHGEKPRDGLGQLNCRGLNRALALPAFIAAQFGKPDAIFAPNPADQKNDNGKPYDYVRPLITIERSSRPRSRSASRFMRISALPMSRVYARRWRRRNTGMRSSSSPGSTS
jgi:hypothetical protein